MNGDKRSPASITVVADGDIHEFAAPHSGVNQAAQYTVNRKALARWTKERLVLSRRDDGHIDALFRYEGTTCTNSGRRLLFDYHVTLGPAAQGYPIQWQRCVPADGDDGYKSMCRYLEQHDAVLDAIRGDRPLAGQPLSSVLSWNSPMSAAGCYCELSDRLHKWRLVLETIHYALALQEQNASTPIARVPATL